LLPSPITYRVSVLLGRPQLRSLCLETELEKRKKTSGVSIPLDKGDRVGIRCKIGRFFVTIGIVCAYIYGMWVKRGDRRKKKKENR